MSHEELEKQLLEKDGLLLVRQIWLACPPIYIDIQMRCPVQTSLTREPKPITDNDENDYYYSQSLVIFTLPITSSSLSR